MRVSLSPSKRRRSSRLSLVTKHKEPQTEPELTSAVLEVAGTNPPEVVEEAAPEQWEEVPAPELPPAVNDAADMIAPNEWEDLPASDPENPALTSPGKQASSEARDVAIAASMDAIEIMHEPGPATAVLLADVTAGETLPAKLGESIGAAPDAMTQPTLDAGTQLLDELFETVSETTSSAELEEASEKTQDPREGVEDGPSLPEEIKAVENNEAPGHTEESATVEDTQATGSPEDPNLLTEVQPGSCEHAQAPAPSDTAHRPSPTTADPQIDSATLEDAVSSGTCTDVRADVRAAAETNNTPKRRPIARISDDTSMLREFVSQAQAKKAREALEHKAANSSPGRAAAVVPDPAAAPASTSGTALPPSVSPAKLRTPRRSPRKILGNLDRNAASPAKARALEAPRLEPRERPGTPPSKAQRARTNPAPPKDDEDEDELAAAPASQRRSTRTRTLAGQKPASKAGSSSSGSTGPSMIPLRRPDGCEPIKIQKSEAQQLALVTRANTRRNKGKAQIPQAMLEALAAAGAGSPVEPSRRRQAGIKQVDWDATLVYFPDVAEGQSTGADKPRLRRSKGQGSVNGTPVAKRTGRSVAGETVLPSTPRRSGRVRG